MSAVLATPLLWNNPRGKAGDTVLSFQDIAHLSLQDEFLEGSETP